MAIRFWQRIHSTRSCKHHSQCISFLLKKTLVYLFKHFLHTWGNNGLLSASILGCWPFPPWKMVSEQDPEKKKTATRCFVVAWCYWTYVLFTTLRGKTGRAWGRTEPWKLRLHRAYPRRGRGLRVTHPSAARVGVRGGPGVRRPVGQSPASKRSSCACSKPSAKSICRLPSCVNFAELNRFLVIMYTHTTGLHLKHLGKGGYVFIWQMLTGCSVITVFEDWICTVISSQT